MKSLRSFAVLAVTLLAPLGASLPALAQPSFSKNFSPDTIGVGNASRLVFTIDNASGTPVTDLAFVDNLPADVVLATPPSPTTTCGVASTLTAASGGSTVTFSGGSVGAFSSCTVAVDVVGTKAGSFDNVSGDLTSNAGDSGPASATLTVSGTRLNFTKSFDPDHVQAGGVTRLTLTIANPGGAVDRISFNDFLPSGLKIDAFPNVINTCGGTLSAPPGGTLLYLINGSLPGEGFCEIALDIDVPLAGDYVNRTDDLAAAGVNAGFAVAEITASVDRLALEKRFVGDPVPPGSTLPLRFTVRNFDRDAAATGITFTDDLDATLSGLVAVPPLPTDPCGTGSTLTGTDLLTLSGGTLDPGESCTFEVNVEVPAGASPGSYSNTTSSVSATVGGESRVGSPASDRLDVADVPLLTKTFLSNPVAGGDTVDVEFTLTNTSSTTSISSMTFTDSLLFLPGVADTAEVPDPGFCGAGSAAGVDTVDGVAGFAGMRLDASTSCTFTMTLHIPVNAPAGTYHNVTSQVNGLAGGDEPVAGPAASDDLVVIGGPRLTKSFVDDPVLPGDTVTLEFTLTGGEAGGPAIDDIAFTDDLDAALSGLVATAPLPADGFCGPSSHISGSSVLSVSGASLGSGDSCTFQVTLQVPGDALPGAYTNNTSPVSATSGGLPVESAAASDDLEVAGLTLTKSFTDDPVVAGGTVTLEFTLTNPSPTDAITNAAFSDDLSAVLPGLTAPDLPMSGFCGASSSLTGPSTLFFTGGALGPSSSCTFSVVLEVPATAAAGIYSNTTSTVTADYGGEPIEVAGATDELQVVDALSISKDFIDDPVAPGATATLRFTLTNAHPTEAATGLSFSDDLNAALTGLQAVSLPASGFCGGGSTISGTTNLTVTGASLAAASSCTFDVTVQTPAATPSGTYLNTTSPLTGTVHGSPATAPPASAPLVVNTVSLAKAFAGDTAAGRTVVLTFTLENLSAAPVAGLAFSDDLGAVLPGLVAVGLPMSNVCGAGSTLAGTGVISFVNGSLGAGGSCSFAVTLQVPTTATAGTYQNTTSALNASGLRVGEPAAADLDVEPPPAFSKAFSPTTVFAHRISRVVFTIDNTASALDAAGLTFTDMLPAGLVVSTTHPSSTCGGTVTAAAGSGSIAFSGGSVGAGMSCTVEVYVTAGDAGTYVNVSGPLTSSNGSSGPATDTLVVAEPIPTLSLLGLLALAGVIALLAWRRLG